MRAVLNLVSLIMVATACPHSNVAKAVTVRDTEAQVAEAQGAEAQGAEARAAFIPRPAYNPIPYKAAQYQAGAYPYPQQPFYPAYQVPQTYKAPVAPLAPTYKVQERPQPVYPVAPLAPSVPSYYPQQRREPQYAILRSNLDNNFDGTFQYDYETENGIVANAVGTVRQLGPEEIGQAVQGSYSYPSPDGRIITTYYTADENGFVAQGDHLPVAPAQPELPPLIAKSVAYILSQPPRPENQQ